MTSNDLQVYPKKNSSRTLIVVCACVLVAVLAITAVVVGANINRSITQKLAMPTFVANVPSGQQTDVTRGIVDDLDFKVVPSHELNTQQSPNTVTFEYKWFMSVNGGAENEVDYEDPNQMEPNTPRNTFNLHIAHVGGNATVSLRLELVAVHKDVKSDPSEWTHTVNINKLNEPKIDVELSMSKDVDVLQDKQTETVNTQGGFVYGDLNSLLPNANTVVVKFDTLEKDEFVKLGVLLNGSKEKTKEQASVEDGGTYYYLARQDDYFVLVVSKKDEVPNLDSALNIALYNDTYDYAKRYDLVDLRQNPTQTIKATFETTFGKDSSTSLYINDKLICTTPNTNEDKQVDDLTSLKSLWVSGISKVSNSDSIKSIKLYDRKI